MGVERSCGGRPQVTWLGRRIPPARGLWFGSGAPHVREHQHNGAPPQHYSYQTAQRWKDENCALPKDLYYSKM